MNIILITNIKHTLINPIGNYPPLCRSWSHPIYKYLDDSHSRYTNHAVNNTTNCIEGIILGYFKMTVDDIRIYTKRLIEDKRLLSEIKSITGERKDKRWGLFTDYDFFVDFLNTCTD